MELKLDQRFKKKIKGSIEDYEFEVGILKNAPHKWPLSSRLHGTKSYAGGPARKTSRKNSYADMNDLSKKWRERVDYLQKPFRSRKNKEIVDFIEEFLKVVTGRSKPKRLVNLLQAIVRNPILRKDYGENKKKTEKRKGFNRYMIDTAQFFKSIKAQVYYRGRHV
jgi:hypothetical protein